MLAAGPDAPVARQQAAAATSPAAITNCDSMAPTGTDESSLPRSSGELVKLLAACRDRAQTLIAEGQLGSVYMPAMVAKSVALALEAHVSDLAVPRKRDALSGIRRLVIAAWRLDADGDLGNKERLSESFTLFVAAVSDIASAYAVQQ